MLADKLIAYNSVFLFNKLNCITRLEVELNWMKFTSIFELLGSLFPFERRCRLNLTALTTLFHASAGYEDLLVSKRFNPSSEN